jgi:hypothetical protein
MGTDKYIAGLASQQLISASSSLINSATIQYSYTFESRFLMHVDSPVPAGELLPLRDAIVFAPEYFWDNFSTRLLDRRITIARNAEQLTNCPSNTTPAIIALDDSDIQNYVMWLWSVDSLAELIVVLPDFDWHIVGLKSLSRNPQLSVQLHSFTRREDLLALKFVKNSQTDWSLQKLLESISILFPVEQEDELFELDSELKEETVSHLEILEQLIQLTATDKNEMFEAESLEVEQLRDQNKRLQSNNASMRIQIETLERKYNTLATSRLGRLALKRWGRK